jgi:copper transport protein
VSDFNGNPLPDSNKLKVKMSNPSKNISSIEIPMDLVKQEEGKPIEFQGELTFGFSGEWLIEIEAQRTENANESKILNLLVKPRLADIQTQVIEYEFPEDGNPLYPLYDGNDSIWISDQTSARLWQFSLDKREFTPHSFDGLSTNYLTKDNIGRIWFTDTPRNQIGFFDPSNNQITTKTLPKLDPVISENKAMGIQADFDGNIWITIINKDKILKYLPEHDTFEEITLPNRQSLPFPLTIDKNGNIWYAAVNTGKIGYVDPSNNQITEYTSELILQGPEALIFDGDGNLWIAEHTGSSITKFNPVLETFDRIGVIDKNALPFGMTFDRYGNIWIAQHVVDNIAVYDPDNNNLIEVQVPTNSSWVEFMTTDSKGDIWFVENQSNKIGTVKITETPRVASQIQKSNDFQLKYTELTSPLIALGIIAASLFYVKSIQDKRRLNTLINS